MKEKIYELEKVLYNSSIYVDGVLLDNTKDIANFTKIEVILCEDLIMAFDREYADDFYKPDWDTTVLKFENWLKNNNLTYHMMDPYSIIIEKL